MLGLVGLAQLMHQRPNEMSGGQRQQVAIARALVTLPSVVLADEPTANLDSATGMSVIELMKKLNRERETTFIFSSHDPRVMDQARRVVCIVDGRIDEGLALHAAVVLDDIKALPAAREAIITATDRAGLSLQAKGWKEASGMVGQMVVLVRVILFVAIGIIFLVTLVIINNTMVMATLERTVEIGTMRAIGAQASLVRRLFLLETMCCWGCSPAGWAAPWASGWSPGWARWASRPRRTC